MKIIPRRRHIKKAINDIIMFIGILWIIVFFSLFCHCSTQLRPNSLGIPQVYDSPWAYMVGSPANVTMFSSGGRFYTNVEFKAFGASMLNTVPILLCGNQKALFKDGRLRAVTYRIGATRNYQGIGCHELLGNDNGVIVIEEE